MVAGGCQLSAAVMRFSLLLAAVAVLAVGGQAAQPMTRAEVLGLFFKTASARQQFDQALEGVMALGVPSIGPLMGQWRGQGKGATSGQVRAPWEAPTVRHEVQRVLDDGIDTLVEQVRRLIEAAAEPLKIDRISLNQSSALVQSVGDITQVAVSHLSTFNIVDRDVDVPTVSANLTVDFEKLDMHGLYNVDATASDQLHIFGDGRFDVRLYRPTVQITIQLGYGDEHFSVEDLSIYVKLQKLKVVMSNFLGGGEVGDLVCGIVSDVGPAFLDMYREEVNQVVSMEVKRTTNALLNKLPINKIIDWIMGGGDDNNDDPTDN